MSNAHDEDSHGSSPAAWIAVAIMLLGCFIGTLFLFLDVIPLVYVGGVIMVLGLIVGGVLKRLGYGVGGDRVAGKSVGDVAADQAQTAPQGSR